MEHFYPHIDTVVEKQKRTSSQSKLEAIPPLEKSAASESGEIKKRSNPYMILRPIDPKHILRIETRETDLPESPKETVDIPVIPDMKKAEEDYNSIDYQIIAFNLWKAKAKELF